MAYEFNWKITTASLLLLPVFISLGLWQLSRAKEKQQLLVDFSAQQALPPIALTEAEFGAQFRRVVVKGVFDKGQYWVLENQTRKGQMGINVIMPLQTDSAVVLVDRGWLPVLRNTAEVPSFDTPEGVVRVTGTLLTPSDSPVINQTQIAVTRWPSRILEVDIPLLAKQYGGELLPKIVKVDADNQAAFDVLWQPVNMTPQKHIGYAAQWFLMALAVVVLWFFASKKTNNEQIQ